MREEIHQTAWARQKAIEAGEAEVVGVNVYRDDGQPDVPPAPDFARLAAEQRARLEAVRDGRDGEAVARALDAVRDAARGGGNLGPPMIDGVRKRATLGELSDALREEWGVYRPGG